MQTSKPVPPSSIFEQQISLSNFSSLESLRETFIATADSMFGPGFTWLIKRNTDQKLSILNTYLAGSPFPGAHHRRQPIDAATTPKDLVPGAQKAWQSVMARSGGVGNMNAGRMGAFAEHGQLAPGGVDLDVLTCVNTWQHCWLMDKGIAGKREYLEDWWDSIDWRVVEANAGWGDNPVIPKEKTKSWATPAYYA